MSSDAASKWWHPCMAALAAKLSAGVLNEMRRRISTSNIQKEKLVLDEDTDRMRSFFDREIQRYTTRQTNQQQKRKQIQSRFASMEQDMQALQTQLQQSQKKCAQMRALVQRQFNLIYRLAEKCKEHNIPINMLTI